MNVVATLVEDTDGAAPGSFCYNEGDGAPLGMYYVCPCSCGVEGYLQFHRPGAKHPHWNWNGNREHPTLSPSIHHKIGGSTHWHGWLRDGFWTDEKEDAPRARAW